MDRKRLAFELTRLAKSLVAGCGCGGDPEEDEDDEIVASHQAAMDIPHDILMQLTASAKYDHINFSPPAGASSAAKKALKWKDEHGDAVKGGTAVGWTRARQLADGGDMSVETVKRMYKFFQRHEKNKAINPEFKGEPWRDNGYVAWLIWGGDAGKSWAEKLWNQMEAADAKTAKDGLWDNVSKKRERGGKPARPGDEGYPEEETWKELTSKLARELKAGDIERNAKEWVRSTLAPFLQKAYKRLNIRPDELRDVEGMEELIDRFQKLRLHGMVGQLMDLESDMWFEGYIDRNLPEEMGIDEDTLRDRVMGAVDAEMVKQGLVGRKVKIGSRRAPRTAAGWVSGDISEAVDHITSTSREARSVNKLIDGMKGNLDSLINEMTSQAANRLESSRRPPGTSGSVSVSMRERKDIREMIAERVFKSVYKNLKGY